MGTIAFLDWVSIFLIASLIYLAYIDLRTFRLPDAITLPLIFFGLLFNGLISQGFAAFKDAVIGMILGYVSLWAVNCLYRTFKKQDGIGMGDAKLLAALGTWFGWSALPSILFIASITGLIGGFIWLQQKKHNHYSVFPFGPFLAIAGIIELLWPQILQTPSINNPA
ncbi:prepilin peptidase [Polynucleobacter necessarius]|uniref:prepilin peptidase n=1 Tax=Polynucleobacter necessarius TaxID=576610 RepID=UPI000E096661|nr:A24 family peptidase [Polynucleobacter necessarius]HAT38923.1 prepilin peptidase [Polynucleobacter sp.]